MSSLVDTGMHERRPTCFVLNVRVCLVVQQVFDNLGLADTLLVIVRGHAGDHEGGLSALIALINVGASFQQEPGEPQTSQPHCL